jgi:hypothetical protein
MKGKVRWMGRGRPMEVLEKEGGLPARPLSEAIGRGTLNELQERSLILCYHVNKRVPVIKLLE